MSEKIERFEKLLIETGRDGMDKLIEFIRKSDFYTAPASTKFHGSCEGGLLVHSLNVYDRLSLKRNEDSVWNEALKNIGEDTLVISALLHDLCKTNHVTMLI